MARIGWADCSAEIHFLIFKALFESTPVTIKFEETNDFDADPERSLTFQKVALVCKEFHNTATQAFFAETTFFIDSSAVHDGTAETFAIDRRIKNLTWYCSGVYVKLAEIRWAISRKMTAQQNDLQVPQFNHFIHTHISETGMKLKTLSITGYPFDAFRPNWSSFEETLPLVEKLNFELYLRHQDPADVEILYAREVQQFHVYEAIIKQKQLVVFASKQAVAAGVEDDIMTSLRRYYPTLLHGLDAFEILDEPLPCRSCGLEGRAKARGSVCECDENLQADWVNGLPESTPELKEKLFRPHSRKILYPNWKLLPKVMPRRLAGRYGRWRPKSFWV